MVSLLCAQNHGKVRDCSFNRGLKVNPGRKAIVLTDCHSAPARRCRREARSLARSGPGTHLGLIFRRACGMPSKVQGWTPLCCEGMWSKGLPESKDLVDGP